MEETTLSITILGWNKINHGRKDVHNPTWFKFKHKFFEDSDFYDFSHSEMVAWLYLLCEASKLNKDGKVIVNQRHAQRCAQLSEEALFCAIEKLEQLHIISIDTGRVRYAYVTRTLRARPARIEERRTDKRRKDTIADLQSVAECSTENQAKAARPARCELNFEQIYQKYPRKEGKHRGMKTCQVQIKTPEDYALLDKAVSRYAEHCKRTATEPRFVKHFSTFMSSWRDWTEPETGTAAVGAQPTGFMAKLPPEEQEYVKKRLEELRREDYGLK